MLIPFLEETFDSKMALTTLYLWLLFGFLSSMVSCDMQRWMRDSQLFRHVTGIIAFFFLFTVLDQKNKRPVSYIWGKTLFVYFLFILMIKSKWQFSLPVLGLLLIDQSIRIQVEYLEKKEEETDKKNADIQWWNKIRSILTVVIGILIVAGVIHYAMRQRKEFGKDFRWDTFFFASKCVE